MEPRPEGVPVGGAEIRGASGDEGILTAEEQQFLENREAHQHGTPIDGVPTERQGSFQEQTEESPVEPPLPDVDNPQSYKYYQSRFSREQQENQRLQEQLAETQRILQQVYSQAPNGQGPVQPPVLGAGQQHAPTPANHPLQPPQMPQAPANYDPTDAAFDPSSESYAYQQAHQRYMQDMTAYINSQMGELDRRVQQVQLREQEKARNDAWRMQLRESHQMSEQDIDRFMQMMYDPQVLTLDNMVKFWRIAEGQEVRQPSGPQRPPQRGPLPPAPASPGGGIPPDNRAIEDKILDKMLADEKAADPFPEITGGQGGF